MNDKLKEVYDKLCAAVLEMRDVTLTRHEAVRIVDALDYPQESVSIRGSANGAVIITGKRRH